MIKLNDYLSQKVEVMIDRPIGSTHPDFGFAYPVNYGYIPETLGLDGEPIDAYVLGVSKPLETFEGICIAILQRLNDNDDKLVVVEEGTQITDAKIVEATRFQEQYFEIRILR